jgi:hypothetical protein
VRFALAAVVFATAAGSRAADAPAVPVEAPVLDEAKGKAAAAAFRTFMENACRSSARDGPVATPLDEAGLDEADQSMLCLVPPEAKPLASGSFERAGADEVVLEVPSGADRSWGERVLALMRDAGKGYQLAATTVVGNGFRPLGRFRVAGRADVLMVCNESGTMGVYPSRCGFFDRGTFVPRSPRGAPPTGAGDELELVRVEICGPATSVKLGKIALRADALSVELIVEKAVMKPKGPDETPGGATCSRKTKVVTRRFPIAYRFDGKNFRRVTRIPAAVRDALAQN